MYTKEQIQNAFKRYAIITKGYTDANKLTEKKFFEALEKEVLFTTPMKENLK